MKILLLSPAPPPVGGIAIWTKNLLAYLHGKNYGYEVIHQNTSYNLKEITQVDILSRIWYGIRELRMIILDLRQNIRIHRPDVIHLTSCASLALIKDCFILRFAGRNKIPVILHWRFGRIPDLAARKNWEWKLLCNIIRTSSISIVIDIKSYNTLISAGFNNIVKIPNLSGFKIEEYPYSADALLSKKKQGSVVFAGHLIKNKGVYELVEACSQLSMIKELILAGQYRNNIKKELFDIAQKRDNGTWLKISGPLDNHQINELMISSPLFAFPSYTEGFPNVVVEAMAACCAVIASDVGAIPEMLAVSSDSPCGICVPPRNVEKLRNAIISVFEDPDKIPVMGKNGFDRVLHNYTPGKVMKEYESVWSQALSDNHNP